MSLQNRVSIAVGLQNGGFGEFWSSVFNELNIEITPNIDEYFQEKDESIRKQQEKESTKEYKAHKGKKKMENLAEESKRTIKDAARHATYLAAGFMMGEEEIKQTGNAQKKKKKTYCNLANCTNPKSHAWNRSVKCRWYGMFKHLDSKKKSNQLLLQQAVLTHLEMLGEEIISPQNEKRDNEESTSTTNLILPLYQHNHTVDYDRLVHKKTKNDAASASQNSKYHFSPHPHLLFLHILIYIAPAYSAIIIFIAYVFSASSFV